jgi:small subunit ribosomal protein S1
MDRERVSLSLKATQEDPWKEFERKYQAGEVIEGQVTKLVPFGAFVRVAAGIEGLVHISELSNEHVDTPESVLNVGDQVRVKVIEVDVPRRRISLSMRQVGDQLPTTQPEFEAEEPPPAPAPIPAAATAPAEAEAPTEQSPVPVEAEVGAGAEAPLAEETVDASAGTASGTSAEAPAEAGSEAQPETDEDVSLESILEDLKRREGRSE